MSDVDWARGPADTHLFPDFRQPRSWKERPIDVRAEAAAQVGPQRRGQIEARRIEEWREQRRKACPPGCGEELDFLREPEIRRRRRADPYYPSSWYRWMGEKGRAYIRAWNGYSWGLGPRPGPYERQK